MVRLRNRTETSHHDYRGATVFETMARYLRVSITFRPGYMHLPTGDHSSCVAAAHSDQFATLGAIPFFSLDRDILKVNIAITSISNMHPVRIHQYYNRTPLTSLQGTFMNLPNLRTLFLDFSNFTRIQSTYFDHHLDNLRELSFSFNAITVVWLARLSDADLLAG